MDLNKLNKMSTIRLEDLAPQTQHSPENQMGDASVQRTASHGAFLNKDGADYDSFQKLEADVEVSDMDGFNSNKDHANEAQEIAKTTAITNMMINPNFSPEEKMSVLETSALTTKPRTTTELIAAKTLGEQSGNETVQQENVRLDTASFVTDIAEHLEWQSQMRSESALANDQSWVKSVADFAELMVPFTESSMTADLLSNFRESQGDDGGIAKAMAFMGSAKEEIALGFSKMTLSERREAGTALKNMIEKASGTYLTNSNVFFEEQFMDILVNGGNYEEWEKWLDNAVSVLDALPFGVALTRGAKGLVRGAKGAKATSAINKAHIEAAERMRNASATSTDVKPDSPANIIRETNPQESRNIHEAVVADKTDQTAQATHGTTRDEALANDILPEPLIEGAPLRTKTTILGEILDEVMVGVLRPSEIESAVKGVSKHISNTLDPKLKIEMGTTTTTDLGASMKRVFGTKEGGFGNPQEAIDAVIQPLRKYGVEESDLQLSRRTPEGYVPVTMDELRLEKAIQLRNEKGHFTGQKREFMDDYVVTMDFNYQADIGDVLSWEKPTISGVSMMNRSPLLSASGITNTIFDPASLFDRLTTWSANRSVDRVAAFSKQLNKFSEGYVSNMKKLSKEEQGAVSDYLVLMNSESIAPSMAKMKGMGFSDTQVASVQSFRDYWDASYNVKNKLMGDTLRQQGFLHYSKGDTDLFVKPTGIAQVERGSKMYNPDTGLIEVLDDTALKALYESGGTISKSRRPLSIGEESVSNVITQSQGDLGRIGGSSPVLNRREGYYETRYEAPHYIVQRVADDSAQGFYEKAVRTAGSTKDANAQVAALSGEGKLVGGMPEYSSRLDIKGGGNSADFEWDLSVGTSQTNQRVRGEQLDSTGSLHSNAEAAHVMSPIDAMIEATASLASKASMSSVLNAEKARFLDNYKDVLPKNQYGQPEFPDDLKQIGTRGREQAKEAGDARTMYNYIRMLEHGYINKTDDGIQAALRDIAKIAGDLGGHKTELALQKAAKSGLTRPTDLLRRASFNMYLALSPLRQIAVQGHQATLLGVNFPGYMTPGVGQTGMASDVIAMTAYRAGAAPNKAMIKATGRSAEELAEMFKEYEKSGIPASISQNNLQRNGLIDIADNRAALGQQNIVSKGIGFSKKIGYDIGEETNMLTAWLAHYDQAKKANTAMTPKLYAEVQGQARSYTYNMNRAGDMPYNQGAIGVLMQFMQVPHKALLQSANRTLSVGDRAKLAAYNMIILPSNPNTLAKVMGPLAPEEGEMREVLLEGVESYMLNKSLSLMVGDTVRKDWSSLGAGDMYGTGEVISSFWTGNVMEMFEATPSGALFMGKNARIPQVFKLVAKFAGGNTDVETKDQLAMTLQAVGELSSGYSNMYKARYLLDHERRWSAAGDVNNPDKSPITSAVLQAFGFRDYDEAMKYYVGDIAYQKSADYRDDIKQQVDDAERFAVRMGIDKGDDEWYAHIAGSLTRGMGNNPQRLADTHRLITQRMKGGDDRIFKSLMGVVHQYPPSEMRNIINNLPDDGSYQKQMLLNILDEIDKQEL